MELADACWLTSPDAADALAAAIAESDPSSLAAAQRLRRRVAPARAAAVLEQAALRRRAVAKLGPRAAALFLTADGLEQATRAPVAAARARRFADAGVGHVVDLGCGIGADALALREAGLAVTAVERDPVTAVLAAANLGAPVSGADAGVDDSEPDEAAATSAAAHAGVRVLGGDAERHWPPLAAANPALGVFCDPARRTASGRTWRVENFSPSWAFVLGLLDGTRAACVKLGPGLPLGLIPDGVEAEWVSDAGDVVECALWAGPGTVPGRRRAMVDGHALVRDAAGPDAPVVGVDAWLYEPDGAVVRAGLVGQLAGLLRAGRVASDIAYLSAPWHLPTPFATAFEVLETLPFDERVLRGWVRDHGVGTLEIKKRGIDVDPAELRRRLKPRGDAAATFVLTPTPEGARALVVRRSAGARAS